MKSFPPSFRLLANERVEELSRFTGIPFLPGRLLTARKTVGEKVITGRVQEGMEGEGVRDKGQAVSARHNQEIASRMVKMYRVAKKAQKELITRAMLGWMMVGRSVEEERGRRGRMSLAGMEEGMVAQPFSRESDAEVAHGGKEARRARGRSKHWR